LNKGHAVVEFVVVFPFFMLMLFGSFDIICLSASRLALQKACRNAVRVYARQGSLPSGLQGSAELAFEELPMIKGPVPRPRRRGILIRLHLTKNVPLRFPLLRFVFLRKSLPVQVTSAAVRVTHG
jgi:hypothetical protein